VHRANGGHQVGPGRLLEHVPRHPGLQEPSHVLAVVVLREHQHFGARAVLANLQRGLEPAQAGHGDVHQHQVGVQLAALAHRLTAVGGLAHHLDVFAGRKQRANARPKNGVVVGD
jgi:hypothetical protein